MKIKPKWWDTPLSKRSNRFSKVKPGKTMTSNKDLMGVLNMYHNLEETTHPLMETYPFMPSPVAASLPTVGIDLARGKDHTNIIDMIYGAMSESFVASSARRSSLLESDYAALEFRAVTAERARQYNTDLFSERAVDMWRRLEQQTELQRERILRAGRNPIPPPEMQSVKKQNAVDYSKVKRLIKVRRG